MKIALDSLGWELGSAASHDVGAGNHCGSSARAALVLNNWAINPVHKMVYINSQLLGS